MISTNDVRGKKRRRWEDEICMTTDKHISEKTKQTFAIEKVTKKFYELFKKERARFFTLIQGISKVSDCEWYTSLMLNRLMFIYFIQRQGFLNTKTLAALDGDIHYLRRRLKKIQEQYGYDNFYRSFLLHLFQQGLGKRERTPELEHLLGNVPYLNGSLFDQHTLEQRYPHIQIPDAAFEHIFNFFDSFDWYLDDRALSKGHEINPDVLGYIFEKYINQKQMGAYYTREDITAYISKNAMLPYVFEAVAQACPSAFLPDGPIWSLLRDHPDDYFYEAVLKGVELALPPEVEVGISDVSRRTEWNKPAPAAYALPTEIWREVVARRQRYQEVRAKMVAGQITSINDLITYNLALCRFAHDVIVSCAGPELLLAFYESIEQMTILDPTCGSGAFLFAALNILKPLYEACLVRMQALVEEYDRLDAGLLGQGWPTSAAIERLRQILQRVAQHQSRGYFILKSIMLNNLYGVDLMPEAVEICKLRLFLKLIAQITKVEDIEPLPDIDFNIRAGNTLIGFASMEELREAVQKGLSGMMSSSEVLCCIECKMKDSEQDVDHFYALQTNLTLNHEDLATAKQRLRVQLDDLCNELDPLLAAEYGIDRNLIESKEEYDERYAEWRASHQPFHWYVEFYKIMGQGGFSVIIGNPPYVEYRNVRKQYKVLRYEKESCGNLYAALIERSLALCPAGQSYLGMIVPLSICAGTRFAQLRNMIKVKTEHLHLANFEIFPSRLFEDAFQRLTILLAKHSVSTGHPQGMPLQWYESGCEVCSYHCRGIPCGCPAGWGGVVGWWGLHVTKVQRWYAQERPHLIELTTYFQSPQTGRERTLVPATSPEGKCTHQILMSQVEMHYTTEACGMKSNVFPKLASALQEIILCKVAAKSRGGCLGDILCPGKTAHFVYCQEATNYWVKATCRIPFYKKNGIVMEPAHGRFLYFNDERMAHTVMALMNSSLFYVWFATYSDGFHLSHTLVKDFPYMSHSLLRGSDLALIDELPQLATCLEAAIKLHARLSTRNTRLENKLSGEGYMIELEEYRMSETKPLIDDIDRLLAQYYGFTDKELDFIINYDIKYRMDAIIERRMRNNAMHLR